LCVAVGQLLVGVACSSQSFYHSRVGSYGANDPAVFCFNENPSCLATTKNVSIGLYGEKQFLLQELGNYSAAASFPTSNGAFGISMKYEGSNYFHRSSVALAYGRSFGERIRSGLQFCYDALAFSGLYGKTGVLYPKAGFIIKLSPKICSGMSVSDPMGARFGKEKQEKNAAVYTLGLGYLPSEKIYLELLIKKEENKPVSFITAFQYKIIPSLLISTGFDAANSCIWLGVGFIKGKCRVDISLSSYQQIGITPGTLLEFTSSQH